MLIIFHFTWKPGACPQGLILKTNHKEEQWSKNTVNLKSTALARAPHGGCMAIGVREKASLVVLAMGHQAWCVTTG